jgi:hypothetical protein
MFFLRRSREPKGPNCFAKQFFHNNSASPTELLIKLFLQKKTTSLVKLSYAK